VLNQGLLPTLSTSVPTVRPLRSEEEEGVTAVTDGNCEIAVGGRMDLSFGIILRLLLRAVYVALVFGSSTKPPVCRKPGEADGV